MGSLIQTESAPERPQGSDLGSSAQGRHGAQQHRARESFGMQQKNGGGDIRPVRVAQGEGLREAIGLARLGDEWASSSARRRTSSSSKSPSRKRRKKRGLPPSSTFPRGREAPRRARSRARAARGRSRRRPFHGEGEPAEGLGRRRVRSDEYRRVRPPSPAPVERQDLCGHLRSSSLGSAASMEARRPSRNGGSLSACPSESGDSSMAKPGGSVAISNSTRPGSRK